MQTDKKKIWLIFGVLVAIVIIVIIAVMVQPKRIVKAPITDNPNQTGVGQAKLNDVRVVPSESLKKAAVVVPGANLVTKDDKVVTAEGRVTDNTAVPNTPTAPHSTAPLNSVSNLPPTVIKVEVSAAGIFPKQFTVKAGTSVTIAFSSLDDSAHTIMFSNPVLSAISIGLGPRVSRAITFNAPTKAGNYVFRCGFPGHLERGEVATMIVE